MVAKRVHSRTTDRGLPHAQGKGPASADSSVTSVALVLVGVEWDAQELRLHRDQDSAKGSKGR